MSNGSGLFSKQAGVLQHLLNNGGLGGEIANVRKDVGSVLAPLVAIAIEEYTNPPAATAATIMAVTASSLTAQTYQMAGLNGSIGTGHINPPRNITVTTAGATATHAPATVTIHGLDAQNNHLSETITGTSGGASTYSGVKCFAYVTSVVTPAAAGVDATFSVDTGVVIGLSQTPKLRAGLALGLIRKEVYDGAVVTSGALTLPATNPPFGAYTPGVAPTTLAPAIVTGSTDITAAGLYGVGGTLAGGGTPLTLILNVNGAGPVTHTFDGTGATDDASEAAMLAAIVVTWPALTAVQNAGKHLVLTTLLSGYEYASIVVGAGSANTALGLTAATTHAGGHLYCIDYEFDATLQPNQ